MIAINIIRQCIKKKRGTAVVRSLFIVARIVCWRFMFGPCIVVQYFLVLQSSLWGKRVLVPNF